MSNTITIPINVHCANEHRGCTMSFSATARPDVIWNATYARLVSGGRAELTVYLSTEGSIDSRAALVLFAPDGWKADQLTGSLFCPLCSP